MEKHAGWIDPIDFKQMIGYYSFITTPSYVDSLDIIICILTTFCFIATIIMIFIEAYRNRKWGLDETFIAGGCFVVVFEILLGVIASFLLRPLFSARYIVAAVGCLWLAYAYSFGKSSFLKKNWAENLVLAFMYVIGAVSTVCFLLIEFQIVQ